MMLPLLFTSVLRQLTQVLVEHKLVLDNTPPGYRFVNFKPPEVSSTSSSISKRPSPTAEEQPAQAQELFMAQGFNL